MNNTDIISFVLKDNRTQREIFDSIKQRIQTRNTCQLTDAQAIEAAQRLIGFFNVFVDNPGPGELDTG